MTDNNKMYIRCVLYYFTDRSIFINLFIPLKNIFKRNFLFKIGKIEK